ncbi:MAG: hypothetical protein AAGJ91_05240 [Pseudomonadota bacterium]
MVPARFNLEVICAVISAILVLMFRRIARAAALAAALGLPAGCGSVAYDALEPGEFSGSVLVLWVGENDGGFGDGKFIYVPVPGDELTLQRRNPNATVSIIKPGAIYTDGGSIPRAAQVFKGFSPWGYAPAYMVHDWLFVAKKCVTDGAATPDEVPIGRMDFIESAEILGEAIKGLIEAKRVKPNDVAPEMISAAVAGPISRSIWFQKGGCAKNRLSADHQAKVDDYIARFGERVSEGTLEETAVFNDTRAVALVRF